MTDRSVIHDTFTLTRRLPASPARVWDAFTNPAKKATWFANSGGATTARYSLDCREGGSEHWSGTFGGSPLIEMDARFVDVIAEQRIITSYAMKIGGNRISVSTQTTEVRADGDGTISRVEFFEAAEHRAPDRAVAHGRTCRRGWPPSAREPRRPAGPPPRPAPDWR